MKYSGHTVDGHTVLSDMFSFYGTHGVSLENILHYMKQNSLVMDWMNYIDGARKDGHKSRTIKARILSAVSEVYGKEYCKQVELRLDKLAISVCKDLPK